MRLLLRKRAKKRAKDSRVLSETLFLQNIFQIACPHPMCMAWWHLYVYGFRIAGYMMCVVYGLHFIFFWTRCVADWLDAWFFSAEWLDAFFVGTHIMVMVESVYVCVCVRVLRICVFLISILKTVQNWISNGVVIRMSMFRTGYFL